MDVLEAEKTKGLEEVFPFLIEVARKAQVPVTHMHLGICCGTGMSLLLLE